MLGEVEAMPLDRDMGTVASDPICARGGVYDRVTNFIVVSASATLVWGVVATISPLAS